MREEIEGYGNVATGPQPVNHYEPLLEQDQSSTLMKHYLDLFTIIEPRFTTRSPLKHLS